MIFEVGLRRIAHGSHQPMEAHAVKRLAGKRWTLRWPLSTPPILPATEFAHHIGIHREGVRAGLLSSLSKGLRHAAPPGRSSPPGWSLPPGAPALTRTGLSPARTARLIRTHHEEILSNNRLAPRRLLFQLHFAFCNSSVRAGMTSKISATTP